MSEEIKSKKQRTVIYIDGFNLYFGMKDNGWKRYYWLDLWKFGEAISQDREVISVKYFTAIVSKPAAKNVRQRKFISAQKTLNNPPDIIKGKYYSKTKHCLSCEEPYERHEEKMTDVNIATHLVNDAWLDLYDVAIVVSGDSDLSTPIRTVNNQFEDKKVIVGFPPNRHSKQLKGLGSWFPIHESTFKKCQLPDVIEREGKQALTRPDRWK
ncbi:NYN domain-containing protein [Gimesia maris]|uniref:6-hydroxy-3-succinoylpyridine 3-monooxygenase HspA n=1 Tax=Gimesia maris TaxID=122 RepID=A0ABX5YIL8_9PLAN|nr:NYN domain-containing protein [Gimesia maris]EDL56394.1 hypothetical protein PM8797T_16967 [Gimesia maris DSM 8797]QEG15545.1 6-hydroxy-3-succinoylpyridine 3-monooxygenase HspA [Gimesia maris]QGQ31157.1 NYN domain-containing protein [Gimesia maris]